MRTRPILLGAIAAALVACGGDTTSTAPGTAYDITVTVGGSKSHVDHVQVCVVYGLSQACGPQASPGGFAVGTTGHITATATAGTSYTVEIASGQQASSFCSMASGNIGVFGSSMPTAVVNCF